MKVIKELNGNLMKIPIEGQYLKLFDEQIDKKITF